MTAICPITSGGGISGRTQHESRGVPFVGRLHPVRPLRLYKQSTSLCCKAAAGAELKDKLIDVIQNSKAEATQFGAGLPSDALKILDQMWKDRDSTKPQLKEEELLGSFDGVASKFVTVDDTGVVTLGRYSFMQFKPDDLKVKVLEGRTVMNKEADEEPYAVVSKFRVAEGEFEGLEGTQKAIATWNIDSQDPARMNVTFVSSKILPTYPQDLDRWKAAFSEQNSLDDNGVWTMQFDKGRAGFRDFVYVDKDCQVSKGNRGSWTVMERKDN